MAKVDWLAETETTLGTQDVIALTAPRFPSIQVISAFCSLKAAIGELEL
jgi:hypothetical protein